MSTRFLLTCKLFCYTIAYEGRISYAQSNHRAS
nr:MAG TPA: hypothetical protein [Caudoviricetes sp.]